IELAKIYSCSDLFVFPSPTETFGNVVLEALASGTPVIGANSGGVKNIIKPLETGYLCEPKNTNQFNEAIIHLLEDYSLRNKMGKAAREYALTQTWNHIFEGLLMEYEDALIDEKRARYA
ncbi:MAG TPA: glycosyltransferase, partial [Metabacillus sp.]|nr:glycosyltransferase [Metabacillus sp.]